MNVALQKLSQAADKTSRIIIGLMSGTSMDGLDIALTEIAGYGLNASAKVLKFETIPYEEEYKEELKSIFCKETVNLQHLTIINAVTARIHADLIMNCLKRWNVSVADIDCIASHGQTIYHAPKSLHGMIQYPHATLQIGDGDHLAVKTGITTISDFRQKHIAAGGEGAPLAIYGDQILFGSESENRIMLNIGGISNFTYLPGGRPAESISTDCGPGNTLSDLLVKEHFSRDFDDNGNIAISGKVNSSLLNAMLQHAFFARELPKTTGQELFNKKFVDKALIEAGISDIEPQDLVATVAELTASSIVTCIEKATKGETFRCFVSGGGIHNNYLIKSIASKIYPNTLDNLENLGINADAKEAVLFALLANETICGSAIISGAGPSVMMGKISLPF